MPRWSMLAALVVALVATGSCNLDVSNPNAPDKNRAFRDPGGLQQMIGGAFRTWVEARDGYYVMPLDAMADNYTASWNNASMRLYSSVGVDCPSRCGWVNQSTSPDVLPVEAQWYGYYTVLSSANDVLSAIKGGLCFDDDCSVSAKNTTRNKAIAEMLQGMAFAGISLIYDQGFIVDENTPADVLANPSLLQFSTRAQIRDEALKRFESAYADAGAVAWKTEPDWLGVGGGLQYTNVQIQKLIRTMEAEVIAMWARNSAENGTTDWASVVTYASQGVSAPPDTFTLQFFIDVTARECGIECVKNWGNSILTERVDTRVAALITTNHVSPWPAPNGNPCPTTGPDKRVGDGTYGPADNKDYGTKAATATAGTDFACSGVAIFPAARGSYHQSNLQHIRWHWLASRGEDLPGEDGTGNDPLYTTQMNDLNWAEGLIRTNTNLPLAATLINNSRIVRGSKGCATPGVGGCGFLPLTGAEGAGALLAALQYEQEIEFMGQGATPFFNRRRIDGFGVGSLGPSVVQTGTPRQMPVPAKELDVLLRSHYTFGGPTSPDMAPAVGSFGPLRRQTVAQRWREIQGMKPNASLFSALGGLRQ